MGTKEVALQILLVSGMRKHQIQDGVIFDRRQLHEDLADVAIVGLIAAGA